MRKFAFCAVGGVAAGLSMTACATMGESAQPAGANMFQQSDSLCRIGEEALFQCRAGAKTIALCGGGSGADRYVQYRYGTPGNVELAYPARGMAGLARANIPFSGGGETQVNFTNAGTRYTVFSSTVRTGFGDGPNMPQFSSGVVVRQSGRPAIQIACTAPTDETFGAAVYDLLPEGEPVMDD